MPDLSGLHILDAGKDYPKPGAAEAALPRTDSLYQTHFHRLVAGLKYYRIDKIRVQKDHDLVRNTQLLRSKSRRKRKELPQAHVVFLNLMLFPFSHFTIGSMHSTNLQHH